MHARAGRAREHHAAEPQKQQRNEQPGEEITDFCHIWLSLTESSHQDVVLMDLIDILLLFVRTRRVVRSDSLPS